MRAQRPTAVTVSIWLIVVVLVFSGVSALLTLPFEDELMSAWREGRSDTSAVERPAFVPVALVMYAVVALLVWVLTMFLRERHNWARISIIVLMLMIAVGMVGVLRSGPPTLFVVLCVIGTLLPLASVVSLLHKDTRAWCAEEPVESQTRS